MTDKLASLRETLSAHGQLHVLRWFDELAEPERSDLLSQLESLDWDLLDHFRSLLHAGPWKPDPNEPLEPAPVEFCSPGSPDWLRARDLGRSLLADGRVAVVTVAGGQGTRLGLDGPKGTFPVTPVRRKTLFQLHAEKLRVLAQRARRPVPWYIMTSFANDDATRDFFRRHDYFGLPQADVSFFTQSTVPALDDRGRLVMQSRSRVFMSPGGHGGTLDALLATGMLDDMQRRSIDEIFCFQVDNVLVRVADPVFLGLHHRARARMSCKVCLKRDAFEKLGVCVRSGSRIRVIEYSDFPEPLALARDAAGLLRYAAGSIAIHAFRVDFVRSVAAGSQGLPWHVAHKKVPCIDQQGRAVSPEKPNAFKFERFIFDALPLADRVVLMQVDRADDFAPVKQMQGDDSPATAAQALVNQAALWLQSAGVDVPRRPDGLSLYPLEISPLLATEPDDLPAVLPHPLVINGPLYLGPDA